MTDDPERARLAALRDGPQHTPAHRVAVIPTVDQGTCEVWATAKHGVLTCNAPLSWGDSVEGDVAAWDFFTAGLAAIEARMRYRATGRWT